MDKNKTLRESIYDMLGLEIDPEGEDEMRLTRDEDWDVVEGVSFSDELDEIVAFIESKVRESYTQGFEDWKRK